MRLTNDLTELQRLAQHVDEVCPRHDVPSAVALTFNLALEEAVTNIISYGYDDTAAHEIRVRISFVDRILRAEITDDGRRFDPLQVEPPDTAATIENRPIGGLGVFLVAEP